MWNFTFLFYICPNLYKIMDKLSYYCFDLDDNLLKMPTLINMLALINGEWIPVKITTAQFSLVRKDHNNWKLDENAFNEFSDDGVRGKKAFINDLQIAIGAVQYPTKPSAYASKSWDKFIEAILDGALISIITARGHSGETLRSGVEWIIDNYLTDEQRIIVYNNCVKFYETLLAPYGIYAFDKTKITNTRYVSKWLDSCGFYGVSNPNFINSNPGTGIISPEYGKEVALKDFIAKCDTYAKKMNIPFEAGMSDDDIGNIMHIKTVLSELIKMYPTSKFTLFDTSNGGYIKTSIK